MFFVYIFIQMEWMFVRAQMTGLTMHMYELYSSPFHISQKELQDNVQKPKYCYKNNLPYSLAYHLPSEYFEVLN